MVEKRGFEHVNPATAGAAADASARRDTRRDKEDHRRVSYTSLVAGQIIGGKEVKVGDTVRLTPEEAKEHMDRGVCLNKAERNQPAPAPGPHGDPDEAA